jgi:Class II Aldolase and Adducin N-terminal domain
MHTEVYRVRPQAGAVIHTHSPHLLAFAVAGRPLPIRYEPLPRLGQAEEVPLAPSAAAVIELIGARPGTQAVLLGGHGVLAFGPDTETTVSLLVALEEAAEAELRTALLGRLSRRRDRPGWCWPMRACTAGSEYSRGAAHREPDRRRAARRRPGGPGAQQPPGGQPGLPEPAHRRVSPAPHLLESRRHLTGAARADGRRAGQLDRGRKHAVIRKQ